MKLFHGSLVMVEVTEIRVYPTGLSTMAAVFMPPHPMSRLKLGLAYA